MARGTDDDALAWGGDDDPTLDVGSTPADPANADADGDADGDADAPVAPATTDAEPAVLPAGFTAVGKGSDEVGRVHADGSVTMPGDHASMGNAALISIGVLGGVYALYAIGWIVGGLRLQGTAQFLIAAGAFQFGFWLAAAAPVLWFVTTYLLTRGSKTWLRIVWLIAGAVLLIPWPFIMTGAVGQ